MNWKQVREQYPRKWVLVEAIKAHSANNRWLVDQLTLVDTFTEIAKALIIYKQLHQQAPEREYFIAHTDKREPKYSRASLGRNSYSNMNITIINGLPFISLTLRYCQQELKLSKS